MSIKIRRNKCKFSPYTRKSVEWTLEHQKSVDEGEKLFTKPAKLKDNSNDFFHRGDKLQKKRLGLYFNHGISFVTKGPISPSFERNSYNMVNVDAFTHYVALSTVDNCNASHTYTTIYEH